MTIVNFKKAFQMYADRVSHKNKIPFVRIFEDFESTLSTDDRRDLYDNHYLKEDNAALRK